jgi:hypothetical protein
VTEPGELVGEFWDPAHSGYRIRGVLTLDSSEHPRVSLERSLTSPYTPYGSSGQSFALISAVDEVRLDRVVGELADGRFIILESAQTVARELSSGQQTIEALSAISGPCPPILPMVFDHFRVTFTSVQGWNSLDFGPPQSLAGGGLVQWTRTPNGTQLMTAEVIDCPPCSHREADKRYSVPIASLLTIASRTGVKAIRLEAAQSKSDVWFSIHYKGLGTPAVPAVSAPPLIDAATLTAERLAEWIMAAERLGPLHALLAHDASASVFQIETRCLVLTTALEGLQSRYAESVEPSAKTLIGRVRTAAVEAAKTVDSAVGERVDGLLQQLESLSYKAGPAKQTSYPDSSGSDGQA